MFTLERHFERIEAAKEAKKNVEEAISRNVLDKVSLNDENNGFEALQFLSKITHVVQSSDDVMNVNSSSVKLDSEITPDFNHSDATVENATTFKDDRSKVTFEDDQSAVTVKDAQSDATVENAPSDVALEGYQTDAILDDQSLVTLKEDESDVTAEDDYNNATTNIGRTSVATDVDVTEETTTYKNVRYLIDAENDHDMKNNFPYGLAQGPILQNFLDTFDRQRVALNESVLLRYLVSPFRNVANLNLSPNP